MFKYSQVTIAILFFVLIFPCKGGNIEKMKQYALLIEEGKQDGIIDRFVGVTPENMEEKFLHVTIQSNKETEEKFYHFQNKIQFIKQTELYPSLDNLIEVAVSGKKYHKNAQIIAWRLLGYPNIKLKEGNPSVKQVDDFLCKCNDIEIVIEGIPLLARLDKEKGFAVADKIISNKDITLKDKMNLSCRLMPFKYTGGYVILQELLMSKDTIIKLNVPMLINYYEQYNGQKATNTDIIIDTTLIKTRTE